MTAALNHAAERPANRGGTNRGGTSRGVLILAGGTGGHIFPGLAVADALRKQEIPVRWMGAAGGMETSKVPAAGIDLDVVEMTALRGKGLMRWARMPFLLLRAVRQARKLLDANRPGCAVSFGGYVAAPGGIAAWTKGIPVLVHEQNRIPGMTNRLLTHFSKKLLQGFPGTFPAKNKAIDCGNPVRSDLAAIEAPEARFQGRDGPVRILITGGSQGAQILNLTVPGALALLPKNMAIEVRHQTGGKRLDEALNSYAAVAVDAEVTPFIDDMAEAYRWADLVICRSGALTVSELASVGLGAVLVPFALAVDDHQTRNAEYLANAGAAKILSQSTLTPETLAETLAPLVGDRKILLSMAVAARSKALPDAAEKVVDACRDWVGT